jgi:hypothetical protein
VIAAPVKPPARLGDGTGLCRYVDFGYTSAEGAGAGGCDGQLDPRTHRVATRERVLAPAAATEEQQKFDRLSSSADLMGSGNAGIRLVGRGQPGASSSTRCASGP